MNRATPRLTAVLGPTNTGKTHLAIERMLGHASGMMGFPLRLLARENYDRVCGMVGRDKVALVTGEEKIVPPGARYFLCTVESMPLDRRVDFLGIDEIQLAADPDRGHIFTDRLLHARGLEETMLLGADTIRPLLRKLAPDAAHIARPRFSTLTHIGPRKLSRLPPRSAVVAFSVADVYEIAELVRRQRGGVAVVMGALSPRTRNAQVQMFQSGAVDFMVATDAIGMGLNMDLDHVAFARLTKFDGHGPRKLTAAEIAQIAGRAGRHMNDGTFGTTEGAPPLDPDIVEAVEAHRFDPLGALFWRNSELDFRSGEALLRSLERRTPHPGLIRVREADDHLALAALWRDAEIRDLAKGRDAVMLLWEVCQVPDFQKILSDAHTRLLNQIYRYLRGSDDRRLPPAWVEEQIERIDRPSGDIDMLMQRLAHIRTWTYVANRSDWLADAGAWQARTHDVEDRLSDALHEALTQRFVDQRHAHLARRMEGGGRLEGAITETNEVMVEGHLVGRLDGFRFQPDADLRTSDARPLMTAARHALETAIPKRVVQVEQDEDKSFALLPNGILEWRGQQIAKLAAGDHPLRPRIEVADGEFLDGPLRERIRRRLLAWFEGQRGQALGALIALENAPLKGAARGLAYQLSEALGALPRNAIREQLAALSKSDRRALAELGLQIGRVSIWIRPVQNARAARLAQMLLALHRGRAAPPPPSRRPVSFTPHPEDDAAAMHAAGYRLVGPLAVRIDALERLAAGAAKLAEQGPFAATDALAATVGVETAPLAPILQALGYRRHGSGPDATFERRGRRPHPHRTDTTPTAAATEAADATTSTTPTSDETSAAAVNGTAADHVDAVPAESAKPKRRRRRRRGRKPAVVAATATTDAPADASQPATTAPTDVQPDGAPAQPATSKRRRRRRRDRKPIVATQSTDAPAGAASEQAAPSHGAARHERKPDNSRRDARPHRKHDGKPAHRNDPPRRKPSAPSPDSPFAILATIDWTRRS